MYRIGIDLGGTNIAVGVVDASLRVVGTAQAPTRPQEGMDAVMDRIADCVGAAPLGETEQKLIQTVAGFLGRQLET